MLNLQPLMKQIAYLSDPTYENFIYFVKKFLAPHMNMKFVEEDYYKEIWEDCWKHRHTLLQLPRGHSKAQPLYSLVLTPEGWKRMGDIKPGDYIISMDGKPAKVLSIHPQGIKANYEIKTRDGRRMECNDEHICVVQCPSNTGNKIIFKQLKEIMVNYKTDRFDKRNRKHYTDYRYFIPTAESIDFSEKIFEIDPYILGYWLGDGHNKGGCISTNDPEILNYIPYEHTKYSTKYEYGLLKLQKPLRLLGLLGDKHIPQHYLFGSINQRESLLQGLMDSDGHVQIDGKRAGFTTIYDKLKEDYIALVRSLGGTATCFKQKTKLNDKIFESWNITTRYPDNIMPFKLIRKRNRWKKCFKTKSAIIEINKLPDTAMQCIRVERDTYITNDYIPTHNTELVGIWMTIYIAVCQPKNPFNKEHKEITEQMILAGDSTSKSAWAERIKHFFYESPYLRWLVPYEVKELKEAKRQIDYWNDRVMYLTNGHKILIRAIGEKAVRGNHVDRLHADDLVTENSTLVDHEIRDRWDGAVDGTTTNKRAMVQVTGTPLRFSDILFHLKNRGYFFKKLPAIVDWEKQIILSPKRWTWSNLMETRERIGSVKFQSEYMLDHIDDSKSLIKREWIDACKSNEFGIFTSKPDFIDATYLGVDFAFEDRITADKSAFAIIGETSKIDSFTGLTRKRYLLLDLITKKGMSALEQFEFIKQLHSTYKFSMIAVEENSIKAISKHLMSYNLPLKRYWTGARDAKNEDLTYKQYETIGKRNLILRLGNMFEQKNVILPMATTEAREKVEELTNECISFAQEEGKIIEIGVHPDLPIAMAYALECASMPGTFVMSLSTK